MPLRAHYERSASSAVNPSFSYRHPYGRCWLYERRPRMGQFGGLRSDQVRKWKVA